MTYNILYIYLLDALRGPFFPGPLVGFSTILHPQPPYQTANCLALTRLSLFFWKLISAKPLSRLVSTKPISHNVSPWNYIRYISPISIKFESIELILTSSDVTVALPYPQKGLRWVFWSFGPLIFRHFPACSRA